MFYLRNLITVTVIAIAIGLILAVPLANADEPSAWLQWTTDRKPPIECKNPYLVSGFKCSGRYCDNVNLLCKKSEWNQTSSWWTDFFSEEGNNNRICDKNGFVTGIKCTGSYCDNVSLRCSQLDKSSTRKDCYWSSYLSEEDGGTFIFPKDMYMAGAGCSGSYCDNMKFYLCRADHRTVPVDYHALALKFAPRIRFDQKFGTDSGMQSKCFPSDPQVYVTQRAKGVDATKLCNQDYSTIANNKVPAFYIAKQCGTNTVVIRYWSFYAWQSTCTVILGAYKGHHAADWEGAMVLIVDGQMKRVAFPQHGGWYSRNAGSFETVNGTHPVVYAGKNSHGSYHDSGGSGGCLYFEDFRNPGKNDYHMDTWNNLVPLRRGPDAPSWMNCVDVSSKGHCFYSPGIGHPIDISENLCGFAGCNKNGCDRILKKTQVGANVPFINAP